MENLFDFMITAPQPTTQPTTQFQRKLHKFEGEFSTLEEAVKERRKYIESTTEKKVLRRLPYKDYPYEDVYKRCCENVIGYIQIPIGVAGPILLNNKEYYLPMATTEGTLVASTSRGAKAIRESGGCYATVIKDSITRAPIIKCPDLREAISIKKIL